jgi:hypothetical protein
MRTVAAAMFIGLLSCAGPGSEIPREKPTSSAVPESRRLANLRRAARYPWVDEGACAAREAGGEWRVLVERCYGALDLHRIQFRDVEHRCAVAQADTATLQAVVGMCLLVQPELVVGAIIVIGVVVVASAVAAEIAKEEAVTRVPLSTSQEKDIAKNPPILRNGKCNCICLGSGATECDGREGESGQRWATSSLEEH